MLTYGLGGKPWGQKAFVDTPLVKFQAWQGELAQMVERSIRIREARGSIPRFSSWIFLQCQPQGKEFSLIHLEIEVSVARHIGIDLVAKENVW